MSKQSSRLFFLCTGQAVGVEWLTQHRDAHIVGEIIRVMEDGLQVTALAQYTHAVPTATPPEALPEIHEETIGNARRIKCQACHRRYQWRIGKAAAQNVVRRYAPE